MTPLSTILWTPALAMVLLGFVANYRLGALINILACAITFAAGIAMLSGDRARSDIFIIDDFNIYLILLTTFIGLTTSIFSATYISHELEIGKLTPAFLRFYHALYQAMMGAMNLALVVNNVGLLWVGVEVATLSTVMMVGIYRTPEAVEAA
jgi:hydrogenase-4 component F